MRAMVDRGDQRGFEQRRLGLARQFAAHDGVLIATPEYNGSIPPLLKNAVDWVSRVRRDGTRAFAPMAGKPAGLCSSSSGHSAGIRAANHLRAVLVRCRMEVVTPECSVPAGAEAFDEAGDFRDARLKQSMEGLCSTLMETACLKSTRLEP